MTPICITQARALLTDPARAATRPGARALAWAMLKTAMGQTHRLARIRARAAHHGITPTGGDAA